MRQPQEASGECITPAPAGVTATRLFVLSPIRIYREGLAHVLAAQPGFELIGASDTIDRLLSVLPCSQVDVVIYDMRLPSGLLGLRRLGAYQRLSVVALGLADREDDVIACAEAGIAGYVTDEESLEALIWRVEDAVVGQFVCTPKIAAGLLRRLSSQRAVNDDSSVLGRLSRRELEVATLLEQGLTNKQIAHRLTIQLATVKNHVHSILEKLDTPSRLGAAAALRATQVVSPYSLGGRPGVRRDLVGPWAP